MTNENDLYFLPPELQEEFRGMIVAAMLYGGAMTPSEIKLSMGVYNEKRAAFLEGLNEHITDQIGDAIAGAMRTD